MSYKCFLIEPIFGAKQDNSYESWSDFEILRFRRVDNGEEHEHIADFGIGAMWRAVWMPKSFRAWANQAEPPLIVRTPGGDWDIDSRASNCTLKSDLLHRCWVRHGAPPNITVDKNGLTCQAGAGSILCDGWHGFLRNGELVP